MVGGERLGVGDVEDGADVMSLKRLEKSLGLDDGPAGGIDQKSAALHESQFFITEESLGFGGEGDDGDDDIGVRQETAHLGDGEDLRGGLCAAGYPDDVDSEGLETSFDGSADGAVADDENGLLREIFTQNAV